MGVGKIAIVVSQILLGKVLWADAKIPRKQRFNGNHCWKLALFEENKVVDMQNFFMFSVSESST